MISQLNPSVKSVYFAPSQDLSLQTLDSLADTMQGGHDCACAAARSGKLLAASVASFDITEMIFREVQNWRARSLI